MKLTTIWTIPAMALTERLHRTWDEWFLPAVAHRLPRRLAYWSLVDSGVRYMDPEAIVPEVAFTDILQRFGTEHDRMRTP